jgi:hypothetical protein
MVQKQDIYGEKKNYNYSDVLSESVSESDINEVDFYGDKHYEDEKQWGIPSESYESTVYGKTGQVCRDDGKFGSFPIEDYYGDGDDPW